MPKKILLDADPGVVDAMTLCLALFDPAVEIVAITSVGGRISAAEAGRNLQAIVEYLDPPRWPRLGFGSPPDEPLRVDFRHSRRFEGFADTPLPVAELRSRHPAEKVIVDAIRSDPGNIMVICLGPLTNLARAIAREPGLPEMIRHLYIAGGSVAAKGNISPCAEFNIFADPKAARKVLFSSCTKTMVPLDVTNPLLLMQGDLTNMPESSTRLGTLLRSMLLPAFEVYNKCYDLRGIHIHEVITYLVATHPEWAWSQEMACDIETEGQLTYGMTVFDGRDVPAWPPNTDVVTKIDSRMMIQALIDGMNEADQQVGHLN